MIVLIITTTVIIIISMMITIEQSYKQDLKLEVKKA